MDWKKRFESRVRTALRSAPLSEEEKHACSVQGWLRRLLPQVSEELSLAALAHDIERALPSRRVRREDFADYDCFKRAHSENSARIAESWLRECGAPERSIRRIVELIRVHEFGRNSDAEARALCDADSLSFFETNLGGYLQREGEEEALRRMRWGWNRLSPRARSLLPEIEPADPPAQKLLARFLREIGEAGPESIR